MQINLHKILGFFAIFTIVNMLVNAVLPTVVYAAEEIPTSFPNEEPTRGEVRVDILEDGFSYANGTICGLGDAFSDDGLKLTIQEWYSDYKLWARYTDTQSTTGWFDLVGLPGSEFTTNETNATYFLPLTGDLDPLDATWEVRVSDNQNTTLGEDLFRFHVITNQEYVVCGGTYQPGIYSISGTKFQDLNDNHLPDFEDVKVANWGVRLYGGDWDFMFEEPTLADGSYLFTELNTDSYYVCEVSKTGWTQVYPNVTNGMPNQSGREDEAPYCFNININSESSRNLNTNDFVNRKDIATIRVKKSLIDQFGWNTVASTQFGVDLYSSDVRVGVPTQYISADLDMPLVATFEVAPGSYEIIETGIDAYDNMGCTPEGTISTEFNLLAGEEVWVVCTNVKKDLKPSVNISASPSAVVNAPNSILLSAVVDSGNGTITYSWECTNGQNGNSKEINLSTIGQHRCTVTVTDEDGDTDTESGLFTVNVVNQTTTDSTSSGTTQNQGTSDAEQGISTEDRPDDDDEVLGSESQVCDTRSDVSGYVYVETNNNNTKDTNEQGLSNIDLTFLTNTTNGDGAIIQVEVRTLKTNTLGRWDSTFCPGSYTIRLDTEDLPEGSSPIGESSFEFSVEEEQDKENVNFAIKQVQLNGSTNWWLFLIPLVLLVLASGGYAIYSTNTRRTAA